MTFNSATSPGHIHLPTSYIENENGPKVIEPVISTFTTFHEQPIPGKAVSPFIAKIHKL